MGIAIAALAGGLLLAVVVMFLGRLGKAGGRRLARAGYVGREGAEPTARKGPAAGSCPLCSSVLDPGERVKSDIPPGEGDRLMRIFGCPRCLPALQGGRTATLPRVCPVCGKELPPAGWVVARYFERPGRRHVHVLGCTACRRPGGPGGRNNP